MRRRTRSVLVVQNAAAEGLGLLEEVLAGAGVTITFVPANAPVPRTTLSESSGLVVLGGPMSVYEIGNHPRLRDELGLIEDALSARKPILGICLGSQLLATALGATVRAGQPEIGWHDVTLSTAAATDPLFADTASRFTPLHWHGDVFDLPSGAVHLAASQLTQNQAFSYAGMAWGLLFHLEARQAELETMVSAFPEEIIAAGTKSEALLGPAQQNIESMRVIGKQVFSRWAALLQPASGAGGAEHP